ncbi:CAP Gly-rich domain-containing protein [Suillus tomentosus]|nr:CAP Gly-rich domain-containing protein [Suillus tomentosus]
MTSIVKLFVISPDTRSERRFGLHVTIEFQNTKDNHAYRPSRDSCTTQYLGETKAHTGIPIQNQKILLHNGDDDSQVVVQLDDDAKPLDVRDFQTIKIFSVVDANLSMSFTTGCKRRRRVCIYNLTGQLSDVSQVEKFELSDNAYAQRTDSVLAYKQRHKVGALRPLQQNLLLNLRSVFGQTEFAAGLWVGVEYDEPMGKNDGPLKGVQYITCRPNYGVFVRPAKVTVGDFPVEEIDFDDEEI